MDREITSPALTANPLTLLQEISRIFSSPRDLEDILERVTDQALLFTHAQRGGILILDRDGAFEFYALKDIDESQFLDSPLLTERVLREGRVWTSKASDPFFALCVPVHKSGVPIGAIYVDRPKVAGAFMPEEREWLEALAASASIAIQNARLYDDLHQDVQELELLQEITQDLTSTLDLERVLTECLERVQAILNAETSSILMVEGEELVFTIALGAKGAEVKPFRVPLSQGIAGWVARTGRGTFSNDVNNDTRFFSDVDKKSGFVTLNLLAAPLMVNERVIGVLEVSNKVGGFVEKDLNLLTTIGASAAIAIENARLYKVAVEKGRLERELQVAHQVQASFIPRTRPQFKGWSFDAHWQPAREVSGDFYDFIATRKNRLGLAIADVSDKGMGAALFMALARSLIRASVADNEAPVEGIIQANRLIFMDARDGMFVTLVYGEFDSDSGEITYVNAGHNPPLVYYAQEQKLVELPRTGMALGILEVVPYAQQVVRLSAGDFVFAYTDGVTDAMNAAGEEFGEDRLRAILLAHVSESAQAICTAMKMALNTFIGSVAQTDDITFGVAKRLPIEG